MYIAIASIMDIYKHNKIYSFTWTSVKMLKYALFEMFVHTTYIVIKITKIY